MRPVRLALTAALLAATAAAVSGCATDTTDPLPGGRSYQLHADPAAGVRPLVVMLHGLNEPVGDLQTITQANAYGDAHGFNVAWGISNGGTWNVGQPWSTGGGADDLGYLRNLVSDAAVRTPTDLHRVYVFGLSDGGFMALHAMCSLPGVFAAAGSVAAPALDSPATCQRPIWRHLHGSADPIVPAAGGIPTYPSVGWCGCSFPSSYTEASRFAPWVSVQIAPGASHSWPHAGDGTWNFDGMTDLWTHVSWVHL